MPDTTTRPWFCPRDETCPSGSHDTYSARRYGCDSGAAREAMRLYRKRRREGRAAPRWVDSTGIARRIEACHYMGHTGPDIGAALGITGWAINRLRRRVRPRVTTRSRDRMIPVLDALAMTHGTDNRVRNWARELGFRPLLAWDDIDDPDETPTGDLQVVDTIRALTQRGFTQAQIAERVGLSASTVRKRLGRVSEVPVELDEHLLGEAVAGRRRFNELSDVEQDVVVERLWAHFLPICRLEGKPGGEVAGRLGVDRAVVDKIHDRLRNRAFRAQREAS